MATLTASELKRHTKRPLDLKLAFRRWLVREFVALVPRSVRRRIMPA